MSTEETTGKDAAQRNLHRPADEIADRPQLKVKPVVKPDAAPDAAEAVARAATIIVEPEEAEAAVEEAVAAQPEAGEPAEVEEPQTERTPMAEAPRKPTRLPRIDPNRGPAVFATHAPPPADEAGEKANLATVTGRKAKERELSAGFLIGVALIVLTLVGGVVIVRLEKHVQRLESRISVLEHSQPQTAALTESR